MANQLYWEDVKVGTEVTPLEKIPSTQMLVKWAGASGDFNPLHYEDTFAADQGVGRPIVHGQLKRAWLVQLVTDWMGTKGRLKKFSCQFRGMDYPRKMASMIDIKESEEINWCKGTVTKKYTEGDDHLVDCDIWVENAKGEKTTPGTATVVFPSKG